MQSWQYKLSVWGPCLDYIGNCQLLAVGSISKIPYLIRYSIRGITRTLLNASGSHSTCLWYVLFCDPPFPSLAFVLGKMSGIRLQGRLTGGVDINFSYLFAQFLNFTALFSILSLLLEYKPTPLSTHFPLQSLPPPSATQSNHTPPFSSKTHQWPQSATK